MNIENITDSFVLKMGKNGDWWGVEDHIWKPLSEKVKKQEYVSQLSLDISRTRYMGLSEMVQLMLVPSFVRYINSFQKTEHEEEKTSVVQISVIPPNPKADDGFYPEGAENIESFLYRWHAHRVLRDEGVEIPEPIKKKYSETQKGWTSPTVMAIHPVYGFENEAKIICDKNKNIFETDPELQGKTLLMNAYPGGEELNAAFCISQIFFELVENIENHAWKQKPEIVFPHSARRAFYAWRYSRNGMPEQNVRKTFDSYKDICWRSDFNKLFINRPYIELCVADIGFGVYSTMRRNENTTDLSFLKTMIPADDESEYLVRALLKHADEKNFGLYGATMKTGRLGGYIELRSGGSCAAYDFTEFYEFGSGKIPTPKVGKGLPFYPGTIVRVLAPAKR